MNHDQRFNLRLGLVRVAGYEIPRGSSTRYRTWPMRPRRWQKLVAEFDAKEQRFAVFSARSRLMWLYQQLAYAVQHPGPARAARRVRETPTVNLPLQAPKRKATKKS